MFTYFNHLDFFVSKHVGDVATFIIHNIQHVNHLIFFFYFELWKKGVHGLAIYTKMNVSLVCMSQISFWGTASVFLAFMIIRTNNAIFIGWVVWKKNDWDLIISPPFFLFFEES